MTKTRMTIATAALLAVSPMLARAAPTVGPINSVLLISTQVPGAASGVSVGANLTRGVIGNDSGGVASVGSITGVTGATNALFGKATQTSTYGVALAPQVTFATLNGSIFGGVDANGDGSLVGAISNGTSNVQSAVVNSTPVAQAGGAIPTVLDSTAGATWGSSFDSTRITGGGTVFIVGRDAANASNLIMGTYSGYAANGSGGTWAKALRAGDTILNPDNSTAGAVGAGTSASATFDASILKVTDVAGTPTYITRSTITNITGVSSPAVTSSNNSVVISNGKVLSGNGNTLRTGQAVTGDNFAAGTTFNSFGSVDIASNGNFAVGGNTTGTVTSFVSVNGAIMAKGGDSFAGITLDSAASNVQAIDVNEAGDYAFIYGTGNAGGRYILLGTDQGNVVVAQQTVTTVGVDTNGDGTPDVSGALATLTAGTTNLYLSPRYVSGGLTYVDIYFGGNGTGTGAAGNAIFKSTVLIPEPTALALAGIGSLAALRRRRMV